MNYLKAAYEKIYGTENSFALFLTTLAALLAIRVLYIQHGWLNDDSVLYFEVARYFSIGEWKQGFALYNWPFYSALIALIHYITAFSLQTSAQILTVLFFGITTFSYLSLIRLAGGNKTAMTCGAFVLFSSSYIVGDVLPMLLRDQGFWAFFISSLVYFVKFYRSGRLQHAVLWQVYIVIATLFRIEAITFLALMPFILFTLEGQAKKQKIVRFGQAYLLIFLAAIILLSLPMFWSSMNWSSLGRLKDVLSPSTYSEIAHGLMQKTKSIEIVLGDYLDEFAVGSLILTFIFILIAKIISATGWITVGLMAINLKAKTYSLHKDTQKILLWVGTLAIFNMLIITMNVFVLSGRYVIALSLVIMIFAAFGLSSLVESRHTVTNTEKFPNKLLIFILVLLCLSFVKNILPKSPRYSYELEAVTWLQSNKQAESSVFYVSPRARYYANAPYAGRGVDYWVNIMDAINDNSIHHYDYLVLNLDEDYKNRKSYLIKTLKKHHLIKEFFNARSTKEILIFKKSS